MENIKYLHVMTHPAMLFNGNVIEMINYNKDYFNPQEHLFIVGYNDINEKYKQFNNVILIPNIMNKNYKSFLQYSQNADFIFLHNNWYYNYIRLIFTPTKIRKKYIWCVWGADLYTNLGKAKGIKERIKSIARRIGDVLISHEVKYYQGIGIGFKYDALEIKRRFKNKTHIFTCPYPLSLKLEEVDSIINEAKANITDDKPINKPTRIMIAHSAHPYLNHIEMLDKLSAYKNENVLISLPLVYGNMKYANYVEDYARNIFGEKVEVLSDRLDEKEYISYLTTVDIGIFDQIVQSGLGNIYYLLYLGKKLYLNKEGILKTAFLLESIYSDTTDKLGIEPYDMFIQENHSKDRGISFAEFILNEKNQFKMWKNTLEALNNK